MAFFFADMRVGGVAQFAQLIGPAGTSVAPGVVTLTVTSNAPLVQQSANQNASPGPATLVATGYAPLVAQSSAQAISPVAAALSLTGFAPTLAQTGAQSLNPLITGTVRTAATIYHLAATLVKKRLAAAVAVWSVAVLTDPLFVIVVVPAA